MPPDVADEKRKGCKTMSDKLLFWAEKATQYEEENKRLKQRINLLQIAGDEARAEIKRLREFLQKKPEPEKLAEDCPENWDEEVQHDD